MFSPKRGLVLLALCAAACADGSEGEEPSNGGPGAGNGNAFDAAIAPPSMTINPVTTPDAGTQTQLPPNPGTNPIAGLGGTGGTGGTGIMIPGFPRRDAGVPTTTPTGDAGTTTPGTPTPETTCSGTFSGTAGSTMDLTLNGRNYTMHIGKTVKPGSASPLVLSLHGLTMTPASMEAMAGWDPVADTEGLIIARPLGVGASNAWDISGPTDFDLMKAIIEDVNKKACVDRKRIYATGFSMGGLMSFAMACKQGDIIAATAPNSGSGSAARGCVARAVPLFAWHGDADNVVAYSGGQSGVMSWVTHDKCTGSPTDSTVDISAAGGFFGGGGSSGPAKCQDWNMCADGSEVKFCTVPGGGHTYTRAATKEIWNFFKAHPLP